MCVDNYYGRYENLREYRINGLSNELIRREPDCFELLCKVRMCRVCEHHRSG